MISSPMPDALLFTTKVLAVDSKRTFFMIDYFVFLVE